jgi:hypothetical protein
MRNVFSLLFGNWWARSYLLLVAVVAVLVFVVLEVGGEDTNLAGVWLILVTLPGSLLLLRSLVWRRAGSAP